MKYLLLAFSFFALVSCKTTDLKPDGAPQPSDPLVNQARLEFRGCGYLSNMGTVACAPDMEIKVITEFPGIVSYFADGEGCGVRDDIQATPPETVLPRPQMEPGVSCALTVIYLPQYPNADSPVPTRSLFGEVVFLPDAAYTFKGSMAQSELETLQIKFEGALRGAFVSRQLENPVRFTGDTLQLEPKQTGTDLILVKVWYESQPAPLQFSYTVNYYAAQARKLTYTIEPSAFQWKVTFEEATSVVTVNNEPHIKNVVRISKKFDGIVRAYTAQGRTRVLRFRDGGLLWSK